MEITGCDHVLLSNQLPSVVVERFIGLVKTMWPNPLIGEEEDYQLNPNAKNWLFFEKDEAMAQEDDGYNLNQNGEGCFSLIFSPYEKLELDIEVQKHIIPKPEFGYDPYPAKLVMKDVWMYTLVLPSFLEDEFSVKVYGFLMQSLE